MCTIIPCVLNTRRRLRCALRTLQCIQARKLLQKKLVVSHPPSHGNVPSNLPFRCFDHYHITGTVGVIVRPTSLSNCTCVTPEYCNQADVVNQVNFRSWSSYFHRQFNHWQTKRGKVWSTLDMGAQPIMFVASFLSPPGIWVLISGWRCWWKWWSCWPWSSPSCSWSWSHSMQPDHDKPRNWTMRGLQSSKVEVKSKLMAWVMLPVFQILHNLIIKCAQEPCYKGGQPAGDFLASRSLT